VATAPRPETAEAAAPRPETAEAAAPRPETAEAAATRKRYTPYAGRTYPTRVYFGDTVDVKTATWTDTIGDPELAGVWTDPDFDRSLRAFYYARVIEIPTPRWTAYDAVRFGIKMGPEVPLKHQERAWTSPVWYTPG